MYYYLVNGQRIEIEVCYSTTTGQYYGRPSETWVVGTQPGHTRRSVLLRPVDCDAYHGITEQDLYCRIEAAHRILAQYEEDGNTNLEPLLKQLLRDLRQHVHLLYLLADGDPNINWVETDFIPLPNVVFDDLMPTMTGNEFKIYLILWRRSWGWNSETCTLSYNQLATAAAVSVSTAIRSIDELEGRGLVTVTRTSTRDIHTPNVYRLNPPPNITPTEGGGNDDN